MSVSFRPGTGLIVVTARIWGPTGDTYARLAVDTGATTTTLNVAKLMLVGYDPAAVQERIEIVTGSGVEYVAKLPASRFQCLGQDRQDFPVVGHTLPPSALVDGLLGLDFMSGRTLTVDFRLGKVTLL